MLTAIGLVALGVVWLLVPLWLVASVYIGWLILTAVERQADALEALARLSTLPPAELDVPSMEE